jgi:hypothetical protein
MDYLTLKKVHDEKMKRLLKKTDPEKLKFLLSLEKGRKPFNPKRKPFKIGRKFAIRIKPRSRKLSKTRSSKLSKSKSTISIPGSKRKTSKTRNPLLKF